MAKSRKKRPPRRRTSGPARSPEQELLDALRAALDSPTPGPLLATAALLLSTTIGEEAPPVAVLVQSLSEFDLPETSAALLAIATLAGDADLRRRVLREIADRGQVLPRWLAELHRTEPVGRAVEITTVYRDADQLVVGATTPGGFPLTAVVLVDNELGAFAAEGYVVESPLEEVVPLLLEDAGPDTRVRDLPPADARARIEDALRELDLGPGTGGYEDWTERRPLVEWLVSLLPPGGEASGLGELSDDELEEITERFLASPFGPAWSDARLRALVDDVLTSASGNGAGDPLVWSPHNVHRLLNPELWFLDRTTPHLERAPELLRDLVRFGHAERGLRPELTATALAAIDAATDAFLAALRESDGNDPDVPDAAPRISP
ncbi:hypothetical protein [Blastococcus atacamensis]|uniref:hypothetical protein n=1 Tax=Blastococcus atacamensis TaxID=2070508 RepID=UPI001300059D|nr:hypothetical protein [Blastococcus atacamensis]